MPRDHKAATEAGLALMKTFIELRRLNGAKQVARTDAVAAVIAADTYRGPNGYAADLSGQALIDLAATMGGTYVLEGGNGFFKFP